MTDVENLHATHPGFAVCSAAPRNADMETSLKAGANLAVRAKGGLTRLPAVAETGDADMATVLLDASADPNWRDKQGGTPLHSVAASKGVADLATC